VRFVNRGRTPHLDLVLPSLPQRRAAGPYVAPTAPAKADPRQPTSDEPRLEIEPGTAPPVMAAVLMYDLDEFVNDAAR